MNPSVGSCICKACRSPPPLALFQCPTTPGRGLKTRKPSKVLIMSGKTVEEQQYNSRVAFTKTPKAPCRHVGFECLGTSLSFHCVVCRNNGVLPSLQLRSGFGESLRGRLSTDLVNLLLDPYFDKSLWVGLCQSLVHFVINQDKRPQRRTVVPACT